LFSFYQTKDYTIRISGIPLSLAYQEYRQENEDYPWLFSPKALKMLCMAGLLTYSASERLPIPFPGFTGVEQWPGCSSASVGDHSSGYCPGFSPGSLLAVIKERMTCTTSKTKIKIIFVTGIRIWAMFLAIY